LLAKTLLTSFRVGHWSGWKRWAFLAGSQGGFQLLDLVTMVFQELDVLKANSEFCRVFTFPLILALVSTLDYPKTFSKLSRAQKLV